MKLVLIGFMGSGKSVVSDLLAERLALPLLDTDALALAKSERNSIADIFDTQGESTFRTLEHQVSLDLQAHPTGIIATGGGLVMNQLSMDAIRHDAQVIYLKTSLETVLDRIGDDSGRPMLRDKLQLAKLYAMRCALYDYYADWTIETDTLSPEQLAETIVQQLAINLPQTV